MSISMYSRIRRVLVRAVLLAGLLAAAVAGAIGCGGHSPPRDQPDRAAQSPARTQPSGFDADLATRLQATLERVREHQELPGAAAAVVIPGAGIWTGSVGEADAGSHRPVTERTLFATGSITKTFVAALMLKLAEDHVLDLDDPLSRWVPAFPDSRRITLRQLLNHTSGTRDFDDQSAFWKAQLRDDDVVWTPRRTLRYAPQNASDPGEDWSYSSTNYILAGLVIERATHSTVARQLHRRRSKARASRESSYRAMSDRVDPSRSATRTFTATPTSNRRPTTLTCRAPRRPPRHGPPEACSPARETSRAPVTSCSEAR